MRSWDVVLTHVRVFQIMSCCQDAITKVHFLNTQKVCSGMTDRAL